VALIREATTSSAIVSLADRSATDATTFRSLFGNASVEYPANVDQMPLSLIAKLEWNVIEMLLRKILQE
jgi:hypothetical protein